MLSNILRVTAVALVVAALLPNGGKEKPRLLVIAFESAPVTAKADKQGEPQGFGPATRRLLSEGLQVDLYGWRSRTPEAFWRSVLEGREVLNRGDGDVNSWGKDTLLRSASSAGLRTVAIGVPGATGQFGARLSISGRATAEQFIGGNAGVILDEEAIVGGNIAWPHLGALERIRGSLRSLEKRAWSGWIQVNTENETGVFKIFRTSKSRYFLSPVYRFGDADGPGEGKDIRFYAPPFFAVENEAPGFLYELTTETSKRPFALAQDLVAGEWDMFFYFDPVPGVVSRGERLYRRSPEFEDATKSQNEWNNQAVSRANETVDARVAALVEAAGPDACVALIVDLEQAEVSAKPRSVDEKAAKSLPIARLALHCGASMRGHARADVRDVAPTLALLLGVEPPTHAGGVVVAGVRARRKGKAPADAAVETNPERDDNATPITANALLSFSDESSDALVAAAQSGAE